ncbi:unnamed protein product [Ranitomeya imitator]|uniref:ribonuclease H n=1 Tax=Ranitomeya imitator TaxID=111125 RepID=A0ABN9KXR9_9NEOB|nr:unnamed protein product [Ranitomeya imitator]
MILFALAAAAWHWLLQETPTRIVLPRRETKENLLSDLHLAGELRATPQNHRDLGATGFLTNDGSPPPGNPSRVGGRLLLFSEVWLSVVDDAWVREIVTLGYKIDFSLSPGRRFLLSRPPKQPSHLSGLLQAVDSLLASGVVVPVPYRERFSCFYSNLFVVSEKDGSLRPILDLKQLNRHLRIRRFKMESLRSVVASMEQGEFLCSVDIRDAYLHVPICVRHQRFLRFAIQGHRYQFTALPFGLASAPRVFTKVMAAIMAILRSKGFLVIPYLDDLLIKGPSRQDYSQSLQLTLDTLLHLGWKINYQKSFLFPTQRLEFLGMEFDTSPAQVFLPKEKFLSLRRGGVRALKSPNPLSLRLAMRVLGKMVASIEAVPYAQFHSRPLQLALLSAWDRNPLSLDRPFRLSPRGETVSLLVDAVHLHSAREVISPSPLAGDLHRRQVGGRFSSTSQCHPDYDKGEKTGFLAYLPQVAGKELKELEEELQINREKMVELEATIANVTKALENRELEHIQFMDNSNKQKDLLHVELEELLAQKALSDQKYETAVANCAELSSKVEQQKEQLLQELEKAQTTSNDLEMSLQKVTLEQEECKLLLDEKTRQLVALEGQIKDVEQKEEKYSSQVSQFKVECENLRISKKNLQIALEESEGKVLKILEENETLQSTITGLKASYGDLDARLESTKLENQTLQSKVAGKEFKELEEELQINREKMFELEATIANITKTLENREMEHIQFMDNSNKQQHLLHVELEELLAQKALSDQKYETAVADCAELSSKVEQQKEQLLQELKKAQTTSNNLEISLQKVTLEQEECKLLLDEKTRQLVALEGQIKDSEQMEETYSSQVSQFEVECENLRNSNKSLQIALEESEEKVRNILEENETLQSTITGLKASYGDLEALMESTKLENLTLQNKTSLEFQHPNP